MDEYLHSVVVPNPNDSLYDFDAGHGPSSQPTNVLVDNQVQKFDIASMNREHMLHSTDQTIADFYPPQSENNANPAYDPINHGSMYVACDRMEPVLMQFCDQQRDITDWSCMGPAQGLLNNEYGSIGWHIAKSRRHIYEASKVQSHGDCDMLSADGSSLEKQCARATCTVHWHAGMDMIYRVMVEEMITAPLCSFPNFQFDEPKP